MRTPGGIVLSVLDQSPVASGRTGADALAETVVLAQAVETWRYHRFWLAEHHGTAGIAGSAPEVMVARVAAATSSMRVGSGGVLLSHYSPLKVAETFRVLDALYPGRIDLGIGRASGASARAEDAMRAGPEAYGDEHFPSKVADLVGFVEGNLPEDHPHTGVLAMPGRAVGPELWLLASSSQSAGYAAELGLGLCFGHFITPKYGPQVVAQYRRDFRPAPGREEPKVSVAVSVICADTDAQAERLALSGRIWRLTSQPDRQPVPTVEEAEARALNDIEQARFDQGRARAIIGGPARVRYELAALATAFDTAELVVVTVCHDQEARLRSYQLLAENLN